MSAAATAEAAAAPAKKHGGKKKLVILVAVALALLGGAGTGAIVIMKKRAAAAAAAEEGDDPGAATAAAGDANGAKPHDDHKSPPTFVPLDPFVVNLSDHDADRYAQIGVTLQVPDAHAGDEITNYKPAIRNNILLLLAHKTSQDLAGREGKELLAREIRAEALRAMGYDVPAEEPAASHADGDAAASAPRPKKKAAKKVEENLPITTVQFSSFIIQ